jgi:hypothetical protein
MSRESTSFLWISAVNVSCGRSTIDIAHRLATIRWTDQVFALDSGRLAEIKSESHRRAQAMSSKKIVVLGYMGACSIAKLRAIAARPEAEAWG